MAESLFEQLGGTYHEGNGYLIPDLRLPAKEEQLIGIWGQLADIDRQAQEYFERLIEDIKRCCSLPQIRSLLLKKLHSSPGQCLFPAHGRIRIFPFPYIFLYTGPSGPADLP